MAETGDETKDRKPEDPEVQRMDLPTGGIKLPKVTPRLLGGGEIVYDTEVTIQTKGLSQEVVTYLTREALLQHPVQAGLTFLQTQMPIVPESSATDGGEEHTTTDENPNLPPAPAKSTTRKPRGGTKANPEAGTPGTGPAVTSPPA